MIGIVVVSHSARLAEGVCELAGQMAQGQVRLAAAGGTGDPQNPSAQTRSRCSRPSSRSIATLGFSS